MLLLSKLFGDLLIMVGLSSLVCLLSPLKDNKRILLELAEIDDALRQGSINYGITISQQPGESNTHPIEKQVYYSADGRYHIIVHKETGNSRTWEYLYDGKDYLTIVDGFAVTQSFPSFGREIEYIDALSPCPYFALGRGLSFLKDTRVFSNENVTYLSGITLYAI